MEQEPRAEADRERHWRANLVAASSAAFAVQFGSFMSIPLIPFFLHRELGIADAGQLALWTGLSSAVPSAASAAAGPVWGMLSDRLGRRALLLRAIVGAAVFNAAVAFVTSGGQLLATRLGMGVFAGVNPAALALVAAETPRPHLARALGVLSTVRALGAMAGPAAGGLAGTFFPVRTVFFVSGALVLAGLAPVLLTLHESRRPARDAARPSTRSLLRTLPRGVRRAIAALLAAQGFGQFALAGAQSLLLIRLIQIDPDAAALTGGLALGVLSLTAAVAGIAYPPLAVRLGFRRLSVGTTAVIALAIVAAAHSPLAVGVIAAMAVIGLANGAQIPSIASMLGHETPATVTGTIFGLSSSMNFLGVGAGALLGGAVAAALGPVQGLHTAALGATVGGLVLLVWGREPAPHPRYDRDS